MGVVPIVNENDTVSVSVRLLRPSFRRKVPNIPHRRLNLVTTTHYQQSLRR